MPISYRGDGESMLGVVRDIGVVERHVESVVNDYGNQLERAHLCFEKSAAKYSVSLTPPSLVDRITQPASTDSGRISGRDRYNEVVRALDMFGMERSEMQKLFHRDMLGACAKLIFKSDLPAEIEDLLVDLSLTELHSEFMAITGRRTGKTFSVGMFVVAILLGVEGVDQAIFSTGRRASKKLLDLIYRLMCKIPGMRESIITHNVETIEILGPCGSDDIRRVSAFPANPKISCVSFCRLSISTALS